MEMKCVQFPPPRFIGLGCGPKLNQARRHDASVLYRHPEFNAPNSGLFLVSVLHLDRWVAPNNGTSDSDAKTNSKYNNDDHSSGGWLDYSHSVLARAHLVVLI